MQKIGVIIPAITKMSKKLNKSLPKNMVIGSIAIFIVIAVFCSSSFTNALESPIEEEKNKESIKRAEKTSFFEFSCIL